MFLYLSGQYNYFTPYHKYSRKVLKKDIGKKIACVRGTQRGFRYTDNPFNNLDLSYVGGEEYTVVDVLDDGTIVTDKDKNITSDYNEGQWVAKDEVPTGIRPDTSVNKQHDKEIFDINYYQEDTPDGRSNSWISKSAFVNMVCGKREEPYCEVCYKQYNTKICGRCKKAHYCSVECQRNDWKKHKRRCNRIAGVSNDTTCVIEDDVVDEEWRKGIHKRFMNGRHVHLPIFMPDE
jgi:hypothetical protein